MQAKEIKTKMRSVANIKKITRTMEMVSVAKMRRATVAAQALRAYAKEALRILGSLVLDPLFEHSYLKEGTGERTLVVLVGSNKGLCGAYNINLGKRLRQFVEDSDLDPKKVDVVALGKQSEKITRRLGLQLLASFVEMGDQVEFDQVRPVFRVIEDQFATGQYRHVVIVFTEFIRAMQYRPVVTNLIPARIEEIEGFLLDGEVDTLPRSQYVFEPSVATIIDTILPTLLQTVVLRAVRESTAAEHSSRMVAMKGATDNAGNLLEDLRLRYNKARQEAITREIAEISAGAQAT